MDNISVSVGSLAIWLGMIVGLALIGCRMAHLIPVASDALGLALIVLASLRQLTRTLTRLQERELSAYRRGLEAVPRREQRS